MAAANGALREPLEIAHDWVYLIDHSVQLGSVKVCLILGARLSELPSPARPLRQADLRLLALIPVEQSTGKIVQQQLEETARRTDIPWQISSDHGSDVKSGSELFAAEHPETAVLYDAAHHGACVLKRRFEHDARWTDFLARLGQTKSRIQQTPDNVGRYGRLTNNITSLKRELRDSLHVNGERLGSVDLSCAQPALLGRIIAEGTKGGGAEGSQRGGGQSRSSTYDSRFFHDGGFGLFLNLVQTGKFYEYMQEQLRGGGIGRDEIKRKFLADVIAKKGQYPSVVEHKFGELFPSVYEYIRRVNCDGREHANLIRRLQREESSFVIETVRAADLVTRLPNTFCISLHDAIYTTAGNVPKVEQAFRRAFEQTGFPMTIKVTA